MVLALSLWNLRTNRYVVVKLKGKTGTTVHILRGCFGKWMQHFILGRSVSSRTVLEFQTLQYKMK